MPQDRRRSPAALEKGVCRRRGPNSSLLSIRWWMSYDVDEYAKLGSWTADPHYLAVAHLLLHDTKTMVLSQAAHMI